MPLTPPDSRSTRKRKRAAEEPEAIRQPPSKRTHPSRRSPPPRFFNNLSKIPFCPRALREFDRRTHQRPYPLQPPPRQISSSEHTSLKRFARLGGPSLDDIRSYPAPGSHMPPRRNTLSDGSGSRGPTTSSRSRSRTGKTSAYDHSFEQHLEDHGIFPEGHDGVAEPDNLSDILEMLGQRRASLSPSRFTREDFLQFKKDNRDANSEIGVMNSAFQTIISKSDIPNQQNVPFGNLTPLTDGTLTIPQPDFYDGCRPKDIKRIIRNELSDYIVPSTNSSNPVVPNFFAEGKGPGGNAGVAKLQACYDAAFGARAIHTLRIYTNSGTAIDGNAYTISATYTGGSGSGILTLYATHPVISKDPKGPLEYHMTQLDGWHMTGNPTSFRQGASAVRNAREWAQEQRASLVAAANAKASTTSTALAQAELSAMSHSPTDVQEADTSADELALDHYLHRVSSSRSLSSTSRSQTSSTARGRKPKRRRSPDQE